MKYVSDSKKFIVELPQASLDSILEHVRNANKKETGGILIGVYSENHSTAIISLVTGPPSDSASGFYWFKRGIKGLKQIIEKCWTNNSYYLGEWHFHPMSSPKPSSQDIKQIREIAFSNQYNCPEPIMLIIGGSYLSYKISVFVFEKQSSKLFELKEESVYL